MGNNSARRCFNHLRVPRLGTWGSGGCGRSDAGVRVLAVVAPFDDAAQGSRAAGGDFKSCFLFSTAVGGGGRLGCRVFGVALSGQGSARVPSRSLRGKHGPKIKVRRARLPPKGRLPSNPGVLHSRATLVRPGRGGASAPNGSVRPRESARNGSASSGGRLR